MYDVLSIKFSLYQLKLSLSEFQFSFLSFFLGGGGGGKP